MPFFKALLFLGAGSVIHSFQDEQDITKMGGVWKKIPYTMVLMLIGTLALTGFPFLSGFYSKDAIIEFAYLKNTSVGYYVSTIGIFTAFLTIYLYFFWIINKYIEAPLIIIIPLIIIAIGALFSGYFFI